MRRRSPGLTSLDGCIKAGSPLAQEIQRLRGQVNEDDDDSTRNELREQK